MIYILLLLNINEYIFNLEALTERSVRIFSPSKPATQSGRNGTRHWRIDFDILGIYIKMKTKWPKKKKKKQSSTVMHF